MKIAIGSDHGGFGLKQFLTGVLRDLGHDVDDLGCPDETSVNYPDIANELCHRVAAKESECGILICGTGIGMSMAANRHSEIRAALCQEAYSARMSRAHNNANVLCLGGRVVGPNLALDIVHTWIATAFEGGRHLQRIEMFSEGQTS